jgi:hypothetical protein
MTNATLICADGRPITIVNVPAWVFGYAKHKAGGGRLSLAAWLGENDPETLAGLEADGALADPLLEVAR